MSEENATEEVADSTGNPAPEKDGDKASAQESARFTESDVNRFVKERTKKYIKTVNELQLKLDEVQKQKKPSGNVEDAQRIQALTARLDAMRSKQLETTVQKKLAEAGCNDPELLTTYFLSKNLISFADDDSLKVGDDYSSVDELIKSELSRRSHLVKPNQTSGVGSRAPGVVQNPTNNIKSMTDLQYAAWKLEKGLGPKTLF